MSSALSNKRNVAIILGALLVLAVVLFMATGALGKDEPTGDEVAVVDADINVPEVVEDGKISQAAFDRSLELAAKQSGLQAAPAPGDEQYEEIKEQAMGLVLDIAWISGQAEELGISATDTEVQQQFEQTRTENFKTDEAYQQFLTQSGLTEAEVLQRVELQLISQKIQDQIREDTPGVTDDEAREFYDQNSEQFGQPESRTIRLIENKDEALVEQALTQLQADNSPESWNKVAAATSTDPTSKGKGGVREGVTAGTFEQPLDDEVFNAEEGELVGPVTTPMGTYVFQVDSITEGATQSFDEALPQIQQQLDGQRDQDAFAAFLGDYRDRWTQRTVCADDYVIDRCDNFQGALTQPCPDPTLPEEQQQAQLEQNGCPPPVLAPSPTGPGTIEPFVTPTSGAPQRPHPPGEDTAPAQAPGGLPGGTIPGAPGGAAPPPQGAAPPPQGAAPPPQG